MADKSTRQNNSSSSGVGLFGPSVFYISLTGLKPDTLHNFYLLDRDVTSDCAPITGTNVSSLFGYKLSSLLSLTSNKVQSIRSSYTIGSNLISGINGKLEFYYFFSPENSPWQIDGYSGSGSSRYPRARIPQSPQKIYVKSLDGSSYAESTIGVKVSTITKTVGGHNCEDQAYKRQYGTCFMAFQKVLLGNGYWKEISKIMPGDYIRGRWGINKVRAVEKPLLGTRSMWLINNQCWNTADHPTWTDNGWSVINKQFYSLNDWKKEFELINDITGERWMEVYQPCHPSRMNEFEINNTQLAIDGDKAFTPLTSLVEDQSIPNDTVLYSLATDGCRTMCVDGFYFSAWANENIVDYQSKIGT